jgi:hypothetical protein
MGLLSEEDVATKLQLPPAKVRAMLADMVADRVDEV